MSPKKKILAIVVAMLVVAGAVALLATPKTEDGALPSSKDVSNAELHFLASQGVRLVDVRTPVEYAGGHIEGAENVPVDDVPAASAGWDKTIPIAVYCQSGSRSLNAAQYLTAQGFTHVYNLGAGVATWDGELVTVASTPSPGGTSGGTKATGTPVMYDFASDS